MQRERAISCLSREERLKSILRRSKVVRLFRKRSYETLVSNGSVFNKITSLATLEMFNDFTRPVKQNGFVSNLKALVVREFPRPNDERSTYARYSF